MKKRMMDTEHAHLVIGYIEGRLNKEELSLFYSWLDADAENKRLYFEIKAVHDSMHLHSEVENNGMSRIWRRLLKKNRNYAGTLRSIATHVAAAVVAAIVVGAYLTFRPQSELITRHFGSNGLEADVIELSDGTRVTLGPKSTISYNSAYGKSDRQVQLQGEAYFQVAKQRDKPFKVLVDGQEIRALGTHFNVTAYPKDSLLVTTLLEGVVQLTTGTKKTLLNPDQQLIYNKRQNTITIKQVDADRTTDWTTGYYHFHEQNLSAILSRMGNVYGVEFEVDASKINNKLFTGTFYRGQDIEDIMQIIRLSVPIKWRREGNKILVSA